MNGDGKNDLLVGCFSGFTHYLPATDDGYAAETWLKDKAGKEIHIGQYWGKEERKWMKIELVKGVPNNFLGLYPDLKDWDGDGDLDLIIGGRRGGIGLRINEGSAKDPKFSDTPRYIEADGKAIDLEGHVSTDFADIDGDGLRDLVCAEHGGRISYYPNVGDAKSPKFSKPVVVASTAGADAPKNYPRVNAADMNGDGKADLLIGAGAPDRKPAIWVLYQKAAP